MNSWAWNVLSIFVLALMVSWLYSLIISLIYLYVQSMRFLQSNFYVWFMIIIIGKLILSYFRLSETICEHQKRQISYHNWNVVYRQLQKNTGIFRHLWRWILVRVVDMHHACIIIQTSIVASSLALSASTVKQLDIIATCIVSL